MGFLRSLCTRVTVLDITQAWPGRQLCGQTRDRNVRCSGRITPHTARSLEELVFVCVYYEKETSFSFFHVLIRYFEDCCTHRPHAVGIITTSHRLARLHLLR